LLLLKKKKEKKFINWSIAVIGDERDRAGTFSDAVDREYYSVFTSDGTRDYQGKRANPPYRSSNYLSAVSLKAYIRIHPVSFVLFSRQSGLLCSRVMPDPWEAQVPTATVPAAQAVLENSSADTASSAEAPFTVASHETLEVNSFSFVYCFVVIFLPSRSVSSLVRYIQFS